MVQKVQRQVKAKTVMTGNKSLLDDLKLQNANIDIITKKLQDYLETKRCAFPRFYFLSDD
jgi:dynein heavy chain